MTCAYPMHEKQNDSTTTPPLLTSQPSTIKCTPYTIYMPRTFKPHKNDSAMSFTSPKPQLSGRWGRDRCVCVRAHASPRPITMKHDLRKEKKTQEESSICTCYRHHPASLPVSLRAYRNTARTSERGTKISECCTHIYRDAERISGRCMHIRTLHAYRTTSHARIQHTHPNTARISGIARISHRSTYIGTFQAYRITTQTSERSTHKGNTLRTSERCGQNAGLPPCHSHAACVGRV